MARTPRAAKTPPPKTDAVVAPPEVTTWEPQAGEIVSDERAYHIRVSGVRYVHVGEAPDGRWVYRPD